MSQPSNLICGGDANAGFLWMRPPQELDISNPTSPSPDISELDVCFPSITGESSSIPRPRFRSSARERSHPGTSYHPYSQPGTSLFCSSQKCDEVKRMSFSQEKNKIESSSVENVTPSVPYETNSKTLFSNKLPKTDLTRCEKMNSKVCTNHATMEDATPMTEEKHWWNLTAPISPKEEIKRSSEKQALAFIDDNNKRRNVTFKQSSTQTNPDEFDYLNLESLAFSDLEQLVRDTDNRVGLKITQMVPHRYEIMQGTCNSEAGHLHGVAEWVLSPVTAGEIHKPSMFKSAFKLTTQLWYLLVLVNLVPGNSLSSFLNCKSICQ
uniref:Uncharacterized protein n=1 Tax=Timema cristinae TaxID=61476 RepID=A0A7R9H914_TIMCR|nr:unnamed protein product [Timema cristinae]